MPLSFMLMTASLPSRSAVSQICPPWFVYLAALFSKFKNT